MPVYGKVHPLYRKMPTRDRTRERHRRLAVLLLIAVGALSACKMGLSARVNASTDSTQTVSGLKLNGSSIHAILAALGPTLVYNERPGSGMKRLCYVSAYGDILVALTTERCIMSRLQIMADKRRYPRWDWCSVTPLAARHLTLANGITLGMSPSQVMGILGPPLSVDRNRWRYCYSSKRPAADRGRKIAEGSAPGGVELELEFGDSGLESIDLRSAASAGWRLCLSSPTGGDSRDGIFLPAIERPVAVSLPGRVN